MPCIWRILHMYTLHASFAGNTLTRFLKNRIPTLYVHNIHTHRGTCPATISGILCRCMRLSVTPLIHSSGIFFWNIWKPYFSRPSCTQNRILRNLYLRTLLYTTILSQGYRLRQDLQDIIRFVHVSTPLIHWPQHFILTSYYTRPLCTQGYRLRQDLRDIWSILHISQHPWYISPNTI